MNVDRFDELLEALLDGEASAAEIAELGELLSQSSEKCQEACDRLAEHRLLCLVHSPSDEQAAADAVMTELTKLDEQQVDNIMASVTDLGTSKRIRRRWMPLIAAGIAVCVAAVSLGTLMFRPSAETAESSTPEVATLLLCQSCDWLGDEVLEEGQRIHAGELNLRSGFAILRFDGGAELIMRDKVSLNLISPGAAHLAHGEVVIRAPDEAAGFKLLTPASELLDLGTEFSVRVDQSGATELDVLEGEVSVRPLDAERSRVLRAGHAVAVDHSRSEPREIAAKGKRFDTLVKEARPVSRWELTYAYEGFYYDAGQLPLSESHRGKGWKGTWRLRTVEEGYRLDQDLTDFLEIVHGQMNVTWPVPGGRLGMLRMPAGHVVRIREMQRPIDMSRNGTYYVSFMLRVPEPARFHPHDDFRLTFRSKADYRGTSISFGVPRHGPPRVQTGLGVGYRGRTPVPLDQSMLCIGKIMARKDGEDQLSFRIFGESDELIAMEPRDWDVVSRGLDLSAKLDLALITSVGHADRILDELRIGPTWRSVVPIIEVEN